MLVLVLETSTSSAKALLYDDRAGIIDRISVPFSPRISTVATQDAEGVYKAVMDAGRAVAAGKNVDVVGLCGIWHSILLCDRAMRPVSPIYTWAFTEASIVASALRADSTLVNELYHRTGCMVHSTYGFYTLLYLQQKYGIDLSTMLFASQSGYIFYKMTGDRLESDSTMSGSSLINIHTKRYDELAFSMLKLREEQCGTLATFAQMRPLQEEAARLLGIRAGIPVVPSYPDGAMSQVGSNALTDGIMTLSVGTSAAMRTATSTPMLPKIQAPGATSRRFLD